MNVIVCFFLLKFDTKGDGAISTSELREAMRTLLGQQVRLRNQVCQSSLINVCITTKNGLFLHRLVPPMLVDCRLATGT